MPQGKSKRNPLSRYSTINKYQDKIILLTFLPTTLIFFSFIGIVILGNPVISGHLFHASFVNTGNLINHFSNCMVIVMCAIFILSLITAFIVSHNMLGAFGRILKELDEIIAGKSQKNITCRPHDELSKDLLKRINVLIEFYVGHKHGK